jgi:hypothetical protein
MRLPAHAVRLARALPFFQAKARERLAPTTAKRANFRALTLASTPVVGKNRQFACKIF